jgi:hypothetical protein
MKQIILILVFFISPVTDIFSQTETVQMKNVSNSSSDYEWDLNKYVWSQTNHDPTQSDKPVINFDIMDNWQSLGSHVTVSPDGKYFAYDINKGSQYYNRASFQIIVQSTDNSWKQVLTPTLTQKEFGFFSSDSKQFVYEDQDGLCFLKLGSNELRHVTGLTSYKVPIHERRDPFNKAAMWIALFFKSKELVLENLSSGEQKRFTNVSSYNFFQEGLSISDRWFICETGSLSKELIIVDLYEDKIHNFPSPKSYSFSQVSQTLLLNYGSSLDHVNLTTGKKSTLWTTQSNDEIVVSTNCNSTGKEVVFTVKAITGSKEKKNIQEADASNSIWYWNEIMHKPEMLVDQKNAKISADLIIQSGAYFTDNGRYIVFSLQKPAKQFQVLNGAPKLTIWSSTDKLLQNTQGAAKGRPTNLIATLNVQTKEIIYVTLEDEYSYVLGNYLFVGKGVNIDDQKPNSDRFWEKDNNRISMRVFDLKNGNTYYLPDAPSRGKAITLFSPDGYYLIYFDFSKGNYCSLDLRSGKKRNLCRGLSPWYFAARNWGSLVGKHLTITTGEIGWSKGGKGYLVYDDYDIWELDPSGENPPICVTNSYGRLHNIVFEIGSIKRLIYSNAIINDDRLLLTAFNLKTKYNGFFSKKIGDKGDPEKLSMDPCFVIGVYPATDFFNIGKLPLKAEDTNVWIVNRHTPETGANYYLTKDFKSYKPLTFLLPQKNVNWYIRELIHYKSLTGEECEGILYKPENLDQHKKYPVIIPFYGQYSSYMYVHEDPEYPRSPTVFCTSPAWLVSHGYLVFVPSIKIAPLKYGPASFSVVEGAAKYLQGLSYIDGKHIGACTHSWSSKLGCYLFTHSKYISAMVINEGYAFGDLINTAFSPPDNNGKSDLEVIENGFEYGELWKHKAQWLDQTTVLNLDKAQMPLLLSCTSEGLQKKYISQSFEIFTALRRLNKPAWWFQYSSEHHTIDDPVEAKDYAIRLLQFFDHYLKDAPAPQWMTQGLPNNLVGVEPRLELDPRSSCAIEGKTNCGVCKKWNEQYKRSPEMFEKSINEWKLDGDLSKGHLSKKR